MSRWFRFYADAIRNPKVVKLPDADYRLWTQLLCIASENEGHIPCLDTLKHLLNRRLDHLSKGVYRLVSIGLIDALEGGFEPHNWLKFQYKSDKSTDRVKRFREGNGNVSETPPEAETDTEEEETPDGVSSARDPSEEIPAEEKPEKTTAPKVREYAFEGRVVKLNQRDLDKWKEIYHAIPDMRAELASIDTWVNASTSPKKAKWFDWVSGMLNQKHQDLLLVRQQKEKEGRPKMYHEILAEKAQKRQEWEAAQAAKAQGGLL